MFQNKNYSQILYKGMLSHFGLSVLLVIKALCVGKIVFLGSVHLVLVGAMFFQKHNLEQSIHLCSILDLPLDNDTHI